MKRMVAVVWAVLAVLAAMVVLAAGLGVDAQVSIVPTPSVLPPHATPTGMVSPVETPVLTGFTPTARVTAVEPTREPGKDRPAVVATDQPAATATVVLLPATGGER